MYLIDTLGDDDRLIATQRYYNLVKSIFEYHDKNYGPKYAVNLGDVTLSWGHSMKENTVMASFLLGEDEFEVDVSVYMNKQWDVWVEGQPVRCIVYERERLLQEFMEFVIDYYPDYGV